MQHIIFPSNKSIQSKTLYYKAYIISNLDYCLLCFVWVSISTTAVFCLGKCDSSTEVKLTRSQKRACTIDSRPMCWYSVRNNVFDVNMSYLSQKRYTMIKLVRGYVPIYLHSLLILHLNHSRLLRSPEFPPYMYLNQVLCICVKRTSRVVYRIM